MPCGATQYRQVMVERSDRMGSTGEGNGKPLQYSCLQNPMNSMHELSFLLVERPDRMWSTGEGNGKPLQYSCLENPMNSMKRQNDRILKGELPRWVGAQYATGDQWRNNSRKNEGVEPKQKQYPAVDVTGDRTKVRCCKEQCCTGTWKVRQSRQIGRGQTRDGKS